jgi:3-methylfumaryl-CoA hydratase
MSEEPLDIALLRNWIGRSETANDVITPRQVQEMNATFDGDDGPVEPNSIAPLAVHWCLTPPIVKASRIGPDGHPMRGGFLPPVPLPRRMWAGSRVALHDALRVGDATERRSRIADVTVKEARTGVLCFVAVDHEISTSRGLAISERQDIVYKQAQPPQVASKAPPALPTPQWHRDMQADPVLLFRYSALTFNGHRIHYDRTYAIEVEEYSGLVVHGPLQATLLLQFAASIKGNAPAHFSFRGVQPLFDFNAMRLCALEQEDGLHLWVQTAEGTKTMDAEAKW